MNGTLDFSVPTLRLIDFSQQSLKNPYCHYLQQAAPVHGAHFQLAHTSLPSSFCEPFFKTKKKNESLLIF